MLSSCGNADIGNDNDKLSVVCTVFPAYDWIREISAGTEISLYLIPSNGTDIHSYQPTAEDIIKITGCDLFVYSEGHEKGWYEDLSIKEKFNMSVFDNHDEHVWLSLKCANELTEKLTEKLSKLNPENKERGIILPDFRKYYKTTLIKTVCLLLVQKQTYKSMEQQFQL